MASVFAYEPDPPRIASPWSAPSRSSWRGSEHEDLGLRELGGLLVPSLGRLEHYGLDALEAEPEFGPVEYKQHLLLRQRQKFVSSTIRSQGITSGSSSHIQGADDSSIALHRDNGKQNDTAIVATAAAAAAATAAPNPPPSAVNGHPVGGSLSHGSSSPQSRQQRLLHLTTQLLWRLKQSSPYHAFSAVDSIVPQLPSTLAARLDAPVRQEKLLPGLEESQGAMYEIGVADNGSFVGLTRDEMEESLINLRAMAASLGCKVQILRAVVVGTCLPDSPLVDVIRPRPSVEAETGLENLLVVEALVLPDSGGRPGVQGEPISPGRFVSRSPRDTSLSGEKPVQDTEQLRVSLTGSTTSGKSTLLGTLLTSNFDDARGKGRLNLLKHRHEIASGVTSSVAHELLGYQASDDYVVNYAYQNVDSWTDVHDTAGGGRLVLLTDSAGHPRYRRTIVRSLVAWQPHWTLCCIAAAYHADLEGTTGALNGHASTDTDGVSASQKLAVAHLQLCLRLNLPLVVVITKYDLATKAGLRQTLSSILTILKAAGRIPHLLKPSAPVKTEEDLRVIPHHEVHEIRTVIEQMQNDCSRLVPIVLTSAVNGIGITKLHALLRQLPIPQSYSSDGTGAANIAGYESTTDQVPTSALFDVDEIFVKDAQALGLENGTIGQASGSQTFVLSGLLKRGRVGIGDKMLLGPFSADSSWMPTGRRPPLDMRRTASYPVTYHEMAMRRHAKVGIRRRRSSEDLADNRPSGASFGGTEDVTDIEEEQGIHPEWVPVTVTSVRNLRLPVHTSFGGQCATVGVSLPTTDTLSSRPRKGMVLVKLHNGDEVETLSERLCACGAFQAIFPLSDYHVMEPGSQFNTYIGSIRALSKVVTVGLLDTGNAGRYGATDEVFSLDGEASPSLGGGGQGLRPDVGVGGKSIIGGVHIDDATSDNTRQIEVMFQFINSREYIEPGAKVFAMPGQAGEGSAALNGYVGTVSQVVG